MASLLSLPCLDDACRETFDSAPVLAAHLATAHLWNGSTAFLRAREAFLEDPPAPAGDALTKEPSMTEAKTKRKMPIPPPMAERTCGACGQKGHRSDHCREGGFVKSPTCGSCKRADGTHTAGCRRAPEGATPPTTRAPRCGYCHRTDGHSKGCKKTSCKFCVKLAPKKCRFHSGGGKPGPNRPSNAAASEPVPPPVAPSNAGNRAKAAASALLTELRTVRAQLDARIKTVEELEAIL